MCKTLKNYIDVDGVKCHWGFKLLPEGYLAITLFGHVFFNESEEWLKKYLKTQDGKETVNHERIHILQAESFKTKYLAFYIIYVWYWLKGLFKYKFDTNEAYYNIPFELEAYANEKDFEYNKTRWKNYI